MEFKARPMRTVEIRATANDGYIVNVGCTNFAYTDTEKMIEDLNEYLRDPFAVEESYNKHFKAYDECAPERPRSLGSLVSDSETSTEGQSEAPDPAADIESSGY
jgi:hypothetical protein